MKIVFGGDVLVLRLNDDKALQWLNNKVCFNPLS